MLCTRKSKVVNCKPEKPAESSVSVLPGWKIDYLPPWFYSPRGTASKNDGRRYPPMRSDEFSHSSSKQTWTPLSSNEKRGSPRVEESCCLFVS